MDGAWVGGAGGFIQGRNGAGLDSVGCLLGLAGVCLWLYDSFYSLRALLLSRYREEGGKEEDGERSGAAQRSDGNE
jgi:hypothetical protein